MSKLKKNKKLIIGLFIVVLCLGIFFFVKEKYIESTTKKIFHDNNQKMEAPAGTCAKLFGDDTTDPEIDIQLTEVSGKDPEEYVYITCSVDQKVLDKYNVSSGIEFDVVKKKGVESLSSTKFVCKASGVKKVKVHISNAKNWRVDVNLANKLWLDKQHESYCSKGYNGAELGTVSQSKSYTGGNTEDGNGNQAVGINKNLDQGNGESSAPDASDGYYNPNYEETNETADADNLPLASNKIHNVSVEDVQINDKPWYNTSSRGNVNNSSDYNTFTHMQTKEMGWIGDTYEGKPTERNLLASDGNHAVFPDDDTATADYGTRKNIVKKGITWADNGGTVSLSKPIELKCNYDLSTQQIGWIRNRNQMEGKDQKTGELSNYYYDKSNTTYFYGEQKTTVDGGTIKYYAHTNGNLRGGDYRYKISEQTVKCTKICQEIVKVQYGPPVYVNAGLCFEYRVKVTSIVRCKTINADVTPPVKYKKTCLPSPTCYHGKVKSRQGGPNEDFEACVSSCDGGMYSKECSDKCYKEVYGSPQQALQDLAIQKMEAKVEKLDTTPSSKRYAKSSCPDNVYGGHYYRSGSSVKYCQAYFDKDHNQKTGVCEPYNGPRNDAGLWYILNTYHVRHFSTKYAVTSNGLIKACQGGHLCADTCYWSGCGSKSRYLRFDFAKTTHASCTMEHNYGTYTHVNKNGTEIKKKICTTDDQIEADYEENLKKYRNAKEKCKAKTVCTTTTSEYRIGFKYSTGEKNVIVDFPYSTTDKRPTDDTTDKDKTYKDDGVTSILSYGGCYANSSNLRWYQTEWTFPGTYWGDKGENLTYVKPSDTDDYAVAKGLVCLPSELKDTNAAWGRKYYGLAYNGETDVNVTENKTDKTIQKLRKGWKCTFKKGSSIANYRNTSKTAEGYNIEASSIKFGFFKWKFNVYCFYSLLNDPTKVKLDQNASDNKCVKIEKYNTETKIDTYNTSDPLLENSSSRIQLRGKNVAYNWKITLKDMTIGGGYNTDPQALLTTIKNEDTFAKPEFKFRLTPDTISKIKKYNKQYTLGKYDVSDKYKDMLSRNGVTYYRSYFLRDYMSGVEGFKMAGSGSYDAYVGINNTKHPNGIKNSEVTG